MEIKKTMKSSLYMHFFNKLDTVLKDSQTFKEIKKYNTYLNILNIIFITITFSGIIGILLLGFKPLIEWYQIEITALIIFIISSILGYVISAKFSDKQLSKKKKKEVKIANSLIYNREFKDFMDNTLRNSFNKEKTLNILLSEAQNKNILMPKWTINICVSILSSIVTTILLNTHGYLMLLKEIICIIIFIIMFISLLILYKTYYIDYDIYKNEILEIYIKDYLMGFPRK